MSAITHRLVTDATTDSVREEFLALATRLASIPKREERLKLYMSASEKFSQQAKRVADLLTTKEQQHIDHVRETMRRIPEFSPDRKPHDFTKDVLYFFVTSSKFDCRVVGDGLEKLFALETERHYREEPHHPQYEGINGRECCHGDIREMAIDRMSRNIQENGRVVLETMEKYIPVFEMGDNEAKQKVYVDSVKAFRDVTERVYYEMFPKAASHK